MRWLYCAQAEDTRQVWFKRSIHMSETASKAVLSVASFVDLARFASIVQVVTGLGVIIAYALSRRRVGKSELVGKLGTLPFLILVGLCTLLATVGAVLKVS